MLEVVKGNKTAACSSSRNEILVWFFSGAVCSFYIVRVRHGYIRNYLPELRRLAEIASKGKRISPDAPLDRYRAFHAVNVNVCDGFTGMKSLESD